MRGARAIAILLGGKPKEIARLHIAAIEGKRMLERGLRFRRHHAIGGKNQRFAKRGLTFGCVAIETKGVTSRAHCFVEAAEPQIDRCDHLPAASILRIALEMHLHLCNETGERAAATRSSKSLAERLVRQKR